MGVYNMGGVRADLPKGDVTYGDVLDIAPFENKIAFTTLKGTALLQLFEEMAGVGGEGVSSSVRLVMNGKYELVSATVNGKPVTMNSDGESVHAVVPLSVTNMKGFDLPKTGDRGTWMYGVLGAALVAASGLALFFALRKRKTEQ